MIRRDEEMRALRVKGFMGEGDGVGKKKKHTEGGLKSSRDAQREETLRMTQFITITATKGLAWGDGGESVSARHYVLQYISNSGESVLKVLTNLLRSVAEGCEGLKVKELK